MKRTLFFAIISVSLLASPYQAIADVLVVAFMDESAVALVDATTRQTIVKFATGRNPHEVRVSPDGRFAYVAAGKQVTAIDLLNRRVKAHFDLGSYSAHDVRISRDGKIFWAACAGAKAVIEVDASTGKILKTYNTAQEGSWFVEVSPDERKLYTPNLEGKSVSVINRSTGAVKVIPLASAGYGIDITPDGRYVWISGGGLTVVDAATDEVVATIKASEAETGRLSISRDGRKVVVALSNKLAVYDSRTRALISETPLTKEPKVLALSGNGRYAYLTNPGANSVSVVDTNDGRLIETAATGRKPDGIAWTK
jgi:YVTN family beta-propeller protein